MVSILVPRKAHIKHAWILGFLCCCYNSLLPIILDAVVASPGKIASVVAVYQKPLQQRINTAVVTLFYKSLQQILSNISKVIAPFLSPADKQYDDL